MSLVGLAMVIGLSQCSITSTVGNKPLLIYRDSVVSVRFHPGPSLSYSDRTASYYEVSHKAAGATVYVESAHSDGQFQTVTDGTPRNYIRVIPSDSKQMLIIEEDIPNEVGPCKNFILISRRENQLDTTYMSLPWKDIDLVGECPSITSVDESFVSYRYAAGEIFREHIDDIEKAEHPTPPG